MRVNDMSTITVIKAECKEEVTNKEDPAYVYKDLAELNAEVLRLQKEAAKDPNHPSNDGLRAYFAETARKLEEIKRQNNSKTE